MSEKKIEVIRNKIISIENYPKEGIVFKDILPILNDYTAMSYVLDLFEEHYKQITFTKIVGTEARGFLFGVPLAQRLNIGFVPARKKGKLPPPVISETYNLEYGTDTIEIQADALNANDNVLIIDDLLATGGTVNATYNLIKALGANVEHAGFLINLPALGGELLLNKNNLQTFNIFNF